MILPYITICYHFLNNKSLHTIESHVLQRNTLPDLHILTPLIQYNTLHYITCQCITCHGNVWHDLVLHDMICTDMPWHDMTWHDMLWHHNTIYYNSLQYHALWCTRWLRFPSTKLTTPYITLHRFGMNYHARYCTNLLSNAFHHIIQYKIMRFLFHSSLVHVDIIRFNSVWFA